MLPQRASTFSMVDHQEAFPFVPLLLFEALTIRCSCESQRCLMLHREQGGGIEWFPLTGEYPSGSMWKSFTRKSHNVSVARWYNRSASRSCVIHSMPPGTHDPDKNRRGIFALRMLLQILLSQICPILFWKYLTLSIINILQQWVPAFNPCALSQHISLHLWPFFYCEK